MRKIVFRGRNSDGMWVDGSYHCQEGERLKDGTMKMEHRILGLRGECNYVDPETVGQYTGLKDKNGRRIFEGDLCLCDRNINDLFDKTVFEINYDPVRGFYGEAFSEIEAEEFCMCEIVGNVHDNPELLKEAE